mmetsp:Transcript_70411/g.194748  ORF Transcript_70411/g.194748 Transcript_70411/m.194748 type:complete len:230 (+) Transcript_70411:230-919(+)
MPLSAVHSKRFPVQFFKNARCRCCDVRPDFDTHGCPKTRSERRHGAAVASTAIQETLPTPGASPCKDPKDARPRYLARDECAQRGTAGCRLRTAGPRHGPGACKGLLQQRQGRPGHGHGAATTAASARATHAVAAASHLCSRPRAQRSAVCTGGAALPPRGLRSQTRWVVARRRSRSRHGRPAFDLKLGGKLGCSTSAASKALFVELMQQGVRGALCQHHGGGGGGGGH